MATIQTLYNDDPTGVRVTLDTNRVKINDNFTAVNADLATKYVKPVAGIPVTDLSAPTQASVLGCYFPDLAPGLFGMDFTGVADSTSALNSWLAAAVAKSVQVGAFSGHPILISLQAPSGGRLRVDGTVVIDAAKVSLDLSWAEVLVTVPTSPTFMIVSSGRALPNQRDTYWQSARALTRFRAKGPGSATGAVLVKFQGGASEDQSPSGLTVSDIVGDGFAAGIQFSGFFYVNSLRDLKLFNCAVCVDAYSQPVAGGERMLLEGCALFNSGEALKVATGDWYVENTSLDYNQTQVRVSNAAVHLVNSHVESGSVSTSPIVVEAASNNSQGVFYSNTNFLMSGTATYDYYLSLAASGNFKGTTGKFHQLRGNYSLLAAPGAGLVSCTDSIFETNASNNVHQVGGAPQNYLYYDDASSNTCFGFVTESAATYAARLNDGNLNVVQNASWYELRKLSAQSAPSVLFIYVPVAPGRRGAVAFSFDEIAVGALGGNVQVLGEWVQALPMNGGALPVVARSSVMWDDNGHVVSTTQTTKNFATPGWSAGFTQTSPAWANFLRIKILTTQTLPYAAGTLVYKIKNISVSQW